jgi:Flp pilus assembly protein TadB
LVRERSFLEAIRFDWRQFRQQPVSALRAGALVVALDAVVLAGAVLVLLALFVGLGLVILVIPLLLAVGVLLCYLVVAPVVYAYARAVKTGAYADAGDTTA